MREWGRNGGGEARNVACSDGVEATESLGGAQSERSFGAGPVMCKIHTPSENK